MQSFFYTSLEIFAMLLAATTVCYEIAKDKMSLHVAVVPLNHNRKRIQHMVGNKLSMGFAYIVTARNCHRRQLALSWRPQCIDEGSFTFINSPRLNWVLFWQMIARPGFRLLVFARSFFFTVHSLQETLLPLIFRDSLTRIPMRCSSHLKNRYQRLIYN